MRSGAKQVFFALLEINHWLKIEPDKIKLQLPDHHRPFLLWTDAWNWGLEAVLILQHGDKLSLCIAIQIDSETFLPKKMLRQTTSNVV